MEPGVVALLLVLYTAIDGHYDLKRAEKETRPAFVCNVKCRNCTDLEIICEGDGEDENGLPSEVFK